MGQMGNALWFQHMIQRVALQVGDLFSKLQLSDGDRQRIGNHPALVMQFARQRGKQRFQHGATGGYQ
ncbi:hypothetical protein PCLA_07r0392 [Pseudomonas citronellolis]|nr:hypothetical protein PCLA_07r0392 [Pseudomonas citronellolis]